MHFGITVPPRILPPRLSNSPRGSAPTVMFGFIHLTFISLSYSFPERMIEKTSHSPKNVAMT